MFVCVVRAGKDSTRRIDFLFDELKVDVKTAIHRVYATLFPDKPPPTAEADKLFAT